MKHVFSLVVPVEINRRAMPIASSPARITRLTGRMTFVPFRKTSTALSAASLPLFLLLVPARCWWCFHKRSTRSCC